VSSRRISPRKRSFSAKKNSNLSTSRSAMALDQKASMRASLGASAAYSSESSAMAGVTKKWMIVFR
jgi:hypothetical protein